MATLVCFGLGYSAQQWLKEYGARFDRIVATTTDAARTAELNIGARPGFTAPAAQRESVPLLTG